MHEPLNQETTTKAITYPGESIALYNAHFFGPFRVTRNQQPIGEPVWRRNKAKALLKWFLLNPGRMFSADQLIEYLWPDTVNTSAERNLHVAIHYLRHLLEPDLLPRHESTYIRRNKGNFYWFDLADSWWTDTFAVEQYYAAAREAEISGNHKAAITYYRQIVEYCNLGFLHEDAYEDIFSPYRRHFERIYTEVLEKLMHLYDQADKVDEILIYAHHALLANPYCEPAFRAIADVYFRQGNSAGAIRKLDHFQAFLKEELGIEPGEDMLSLRKKIAKLE